MRPRRVLRLLRSGAVVVVLIPTCLVASTDAAAVRPTTDLPAVTEQAGNHIRQIRARYAERYAQRPSRTWGGARR